MVCNDTEKSNCLIIIQKLNQEQKKFSKEEFLKYIYDEQNREEQYLIAYTGDSVLALSKERIPYNVKDPWINTFRKNLSEQLKKLCSDEGQMLKAYYCQTEDYGKKAWYKKTFDLDNILFYNLKKPSAFSGIADKHIYAKCSKENDIDNTIKTILNLPEEEIKNFPCRYVYRVEPSSKPEQSWPVPAVRWEKISIDKNPGADRKPFDYWKILKTNEKEINKCKDSPECIDGDFGVKITLCVPKGKKLNLAAAVKPMLDGVICAFHGLKGKAYSDDMHLAFKRLDVEIGSNDKKMNILGCRKFIYTFGKKGVKWNPADDRCKAFEIEAIQSKGTKFSFSGGIYPLD